MVPSYSAIALFVRTCSLYGLAVFRVGFIYVRDWSGYPSKLTVKTDIRHRRIGANSGREQVQQQRLQMPAYSITSSTSASRFAGIAPLFKAITQPSERGLPASAE